MFNTSQPGPKDDKKKFKNIGVGLGGLGLGYGGVKIGQAADKLKRSTPAHTIDKMKAAWRRLLRNQLKSQRFSSKSKLIKFAKPGEMFKKYVPDSIWNTDQDARTLKNSALKKTKSRVIPQYNYTAKDHRNLDALAIKHTIERENAKAKGAPPEALQAMSKRHSQERNATKPPKGHIITKPQSDQRAMLKADVGTNLGGEHTEYHKQRQRIKDTHSGEMSRYEGASEETIASLTRKHKEELGKHRKAYLHEVGKQKGYARHQEVRRSNIRGLMADQLNERRQALQGIRKHVVGSLPSPLAPDAMKAIKESAKKMTQVGVSMRGVQTGIANRHGKDAPFKLGGYDVPDLPKRLADVDKDIKGAVAGEAGKLAKRHERLYDHLTKRAAKTIKSRNPNIGKKELVSKTRSTVHDIFQPTAPSGVKRETAAKNLGYDAPMVDKIHAHQNKLGIWKDTHAGESVLRKRVINEGKIFAPPPPLKISKYPDLKRLGKGAGVAGAVVGGVLMARQIIKNRKKHKNQTTNFSSIEFGKFDPLTKFRVDKLGRLQGLGVPKEADEIMTAAKHLHRAKLAARRKDLGVFREAGIDAGLLHKNIGIEEADLQMKLHREAIAEQIKTGRRLSKIPQREIFERGLRQGRNIETKRVYKEGQKQAGHVAAKKIATKEKEVASKVESARDRATRRGNRNSLIAGASGLAAGSYLGQAKKKKKEETRFSSREHKLSPTTKAGLSAAASGALLGSLPAFKIGVKAKTVLKSIAGGTALGATLGGGGTYVGNKILGPPKRGEGAPFTKRAAVGGGLLGTGLGIATGVLGHKTKFGKNLLKKLAVNYRPAVWAQRSGATGAASIGGLAGGILAAAHAADEGQQVDTLQALTKAKRKTHKMNVPRRTIEFDLPKKKLSVAQDRYKKKIHEQERQRMESNLVRSALAGGVLSHVLRNKTGLSSGKASLAGAGAGLLAQGALIANSRKTKDAFGDRSYAAKRAEKLPYQIGALAALGISGRQLYKKIHKFAVDEEDKLTVPYFAKRRWKNRSLPRRGEELQTGAKRTAAFIEDLKARKEGKPIVDERGRPKTPEWNKPYAHKAYAGAALVGVLLGGKLAITKSKAIRSLAQNAKNLVNRVPGVKKTTDFVKGVGTDTKALMKSLDEKAADKVKTAAQKKAEDVLTAAEEEKRRRKIQKATEGRIPLSSKLKTIKFAQTVPDWDIRDQRGKSARIYAPGSQKRERREKKWHERTANQRHIWEAVSAATGVSGVGGTVLYYKNKNKPKASSTPFTAVRVGEETLTQMPVQTADKYIWARRLRKVKHLSAKLDDIIYASQG